MTNETYGNYYTFIDS